MKPKTTTAAIHQKTVTWNLPPTNSPNSCLATGPASSATLVLPARMTEKPSVRPATANSVARVTTKDGRSVRITRYPLMKPTASPMPSAAMIPTMIGAS